MIFLGLQGKDFLKSYPNWDSPFRRHLGYFECKYSRDAYNVYVYDDANVDGNVVTASLSADNNDDYEIDADDNNVVINMSLRVFMCNTYLKGLSLNLTHCTCNLTPRILSLILSSSGPKDMNNSFDCLSSPTGR
uniref:Uncharacterized protein n=1 Tax=Glossina pallidipes TaxID=7398 RepID=A0A1A9ZHU5_GLOPL